MLTVSTKIRYSVRALMYIAMQSTEAAIPLQEISKHEAISVKYLEAIMPALKSVGLITSSKGPSGGHRLSRPAAEITLLDVVSAFGGPVALVECAGSSPRCNRRDNCAAHDAWREISVMINDKFRSISIEELAIRQLAKTNSNASLIYAI